MKYAIYTLIVISRMILVARCEGTAEGQQPPPPATQTGGTGGTGSNGGTGGSQSPFPFLPPLGQSGGAGGQQSPFPFPPFQQFLPPFGQTPQASGGTPGGQGNAGPTGGGFMKPLMDFAGKATGTFVEGLTLPLNMMQQFFPR